MDPMPVEHSQMASHLGQWAWLQLPRVLCSSWDIGAPSDAGVPLNM